MMITATATHVFTGAMDAVHDQPAFLITVDTEGDNLWSSPARIETRNAAYLPRFQELCEQFDLRPTYLTNWEMASSPEFCEFAIDVLRRDAAEVGMHLHAWNNPPLSEEEIHNPQRQTCLIESAPDVMREKVVRLTGLLEDTFDTKMVSHRAGRWGLNPAYARILVDNGYLVDCSVTPNIHWQYRHADGAGCQFDYRKFPRDAYWCNLDNLQRGGDSPLLEVPMSIFDGSQSVWARSLRQVARPSTMARRVVNRIAPEHLWFRPFRGNSVQLPQLLDRAYAEERDYIEFAMHSSELMPGGSPSFPTRIAIEQLYGRLETLFSRASKNFVGLTLAEYRQRFVQRQERSHPASKTASNSHGD
jgi:hypothetical protein